MIVAPGTSFVILTDTVQLIIPSGTNSVTSGNLQLQHAEAAREFKEWPNLERAGEKQFAEAVSKTFIALVFDCNWVFVHLRVRDIVAHLFTEYGKVENQDPIRKLLKVVGAVGREQTIPGISATGPGNPNVFERQRVDNRRWRYCRHSLHARV